MILQQQNDPLVVVRQTDHAYLAGFFARELGNEAFEKPEPFDSFCLAAAEHDNGWQEWELAPGVDPKTFAAYSFMTIPTEEHIALYQHGIERVVKADLYAGLLVAGHVAGLYDRAHATMPGYSAKYVKGNEQHLANDFVQRLRLQQLRLKLDLRSDPAKKPFTDEKLIKMNQQRLDALDRLSLYFCMGGNNDIVIEGVPIDEQGGEVDWELRSIGGYEYSLAPYPFRRDPLQFAILARRIPRMRYTDDVELQKELAAAPFFNLKFTLRSGAASETSYAAGA
ncbi:MAG TPA: DUF3891 family protein [Candidatus Acidoferrum sp.]|nr:DUF3891 family protein [Candidatus Acidoferrum sp.]